MLGPRGTGKTTWLRSIFPDALVLDLLEPRLYRELSAHPERLRERVRGVPPGTIIVLDEVQRVPELLNVVHAILESPEARRFALTGSSARKLRRGGVDLLAGRALYLTMHPFLAAEVSEFDLDRALTVGMVPLVVAAPDPLAALGAYATLYLEQEVQAEGLTRNVGAFARFLEAASFAHASSLNVANVARECQIERKTVAGYLQILEDLLLSFQLPVFRRRAKRALALHPKFYLFDAGIYRSLRPSGPIDRAEEIEGTALEGLVAQHLRGWIAYSGDAFSLSFWRTRAGAEVDFVVYGATGFWALEVKNSKRVHPEHLTSLRAFAGEYPECEVALLYRGTEWLRFDHIWCIPVESFLKGIRPGAPLPVGPRQGLDD